MTEADGRNVATVERLFSRPPPVAGGRAGGRPSISRRDGGERCGYRDGGGTPGMQCASMHCDIMAVRNPLRMV